jgi:hypothetical protein
VNFLRGGDGKEIKEKGENKGWKTAMGGWKNSSWQLVIRFAGKF